MIIPEFSIENNPPIDNPFITPEGYDVSQLEPAIAYLRDEHGRDPELFDPKGELDIITGFHISHGLQSIDRAVGPEKGETRRQNDAEHTLNAISLARNIARKHNLPLDLDLVVDLLMLHDAVEIYADDTAIGDEKKEATKFFREKAGYTIFKDRYKDDPETVAHIEELENPTKPETFYAKKIDKIEPFYYALATRAATQIENGEDFVALLDRAISKVYDDPIVLQYLIKAADQIGRKWRKDWGGKDFEGHHMDVIFGIVEKYQNKAFKETQARKLQAQNSLSASTYVGQSAVGHQTEKPQ